MASSVNGNSTSETQNGSQIKYGERLLPQVLDNWAAEDPDYIVGMMAKPESTTVPLDFTELSVSQLASTVDYTSHWLAKNLSTAPQTTTTPETIAFVGLQDFRYRVMWYAALKSGRQLLLPNPRNALFNTVSLLRSTHCTTLFSTGPFNGQATALAQAVPSLRTVALPPLDEMLLTPTPTPHYPYTKTFWQARNDIVLIVHTSSSTGDPKPDHPLHQRVLQPRRPRRPDPARGGGREHASTFALCRPVTKVFLGTNFFHLSGIHFSTAALFRRFTTVWGPPDQLPRGEVAADVLKSVRVQVVVVVPSVCDAVFMGYGRELMEQEHLQELEHVNWTLADATGDWITTHLPRVKLWQIFGSTEVAALPLLIPRARSHWSYIEFHPVIGPALDATSDDPALFEVVRRPLPPGAPEYT
ncbi:Uu.00g073370.m01.CDS01 [Anthostomella pinea]|uniref:Uu.00g073370.m01.CDS01 n=1 Tax=Anthostomella pinea TaxID=933095 RepID=A0AAI8VV85_9PEZI|nr:Uu.00g073370.m01.CDS01 [Anthostomella pinea]